MWQRFFNTDPQRPNGQMNGDGCGIMDRHEFAVSLQHPWMSGTPFYAPDQWAPTYEYPLICYLHDDNRNEQDLWNWFPAISDQNFLGVGVRAPFPMPNAMPGRYRWRGQRPDATSAVLQEAIDLVDRGWNIHPDRIYLMGEGNGAIVALQQFLLNQFHREPDEILFAGVICRNLPSWWARTLPPVADFASGRILMLDPVSPEDEGETLAALDGMQESGISVTLCGPEPTDPAQVINHWILSGISTAVF